MMRLIEKTENDQKNKKHEGILLALALIVLIITLLAAVLLDGNGFLYLVDFTSILLLDIFVTLSLVAAGLWQDFWMALRFAFSSSAADADKDRRSQSAVRLTSRSMLASGLVLGVIGALQLLSASGGSDLSGQGAVVLLAPMYGLLGYLFLLPVQSRLENRLGAE